MAEVIRLEIHVDDKGTPIIKTVAKSLDELGAKATTGAGGLLKLNEAGKSSQGVWADLKESWASLAPPGVAVMATLGGAVAGLTLIGKQSVEAFQALAFQTRDLAYISGGTAKEVSGLIDALGDYGVKASTAEHAMIFLSKAAQTGAPALDRLGIAIRDDNGHLKTAHRLFYEVIDALNDVQSETERNALAQEVFSRGWAEMVPIIQRGSAALREAAAASGLALSEEDIRRADQYRGMVDELGDSLENLKLRFAGGLVIPILLSVVKPATPNPHDPEIERGVAEAFNAYAWAGQTGPYTPSLPEPPGPSADFTRTEALRIMREPDPEQEGEKKQREAAEKAARERAQAWLKSNDVIEKANAQALAQMQQDAAEFQTWDAAETKKREANDAYVVEKQLAGLAELEKARLELSQWETDQATKQAAADAALRAQTLQGRKDLLDEQNKYILDAEQRGALTAEQSIELQRRNWEDYHRDIERLRDRALRYEADRAARWGNLWTAGALDAQRALGTTGDNIRRGFERTFLDVQKSASDVLFDGLTNGFRDLGDIVDDFGRTMLRTFTDIMAAEATKGLLSLIGGGSGGVNWGGLLSGAGSLLGSAWGGISSGLSWLGGAIGFQTGLWRVPDMPGREAAFIHPGEMILPPEVAERVRQMGGVMGWGPGLPGFAGAYASGDGTGGVGNGPMDRGGFGFHTAMVDTLNSLGLTAEAKAYTALEAFSAMFGSLKAVGAVTPIGLAGALVDTALGSRAAKASAFAALGFTKEEAAALAAGYSEHAVTGQWGPAEFAAALAHDLAEQAAGRAMEAAEQAARHAEAAREAEAAMLSGRAVDTTGYGPGFGGDYGTFGGSWGEPGNYGGWGGDSSGGGVGSGSSSGGGQSSGSASSEGGADARLLGGPVEAGRQYIVHPPELFIPGADGYVVSRQDTQRLLHGGGRSVQLVVQGPLVTVDARGSVVGEAIPERTAVAVRQALRRLDRVYREY
jgi:hypothetical protein